MRFDDMLATVYAHPTNDSGAVSAAWMQIVDILAQDRGSISPSSKENAFAKLTHMRAQVPLARRRATAQSLAGRAISSDLLRFIAADVPLVAAPVLLSAEMDDEDWAEIIPTLSPPSRALLRERRELSASVKQMLAGYGVSDFSLPSAQGNIVAFPSEERAFPTPSSQIRELVARIEAYRHDRETEQKSEASPPTKQEAVTAFRFETSIDGLISWVEGAPRGPIIGIETGSMAHFGGHGVDGHAAGAFKRRTPFRNANMIVPGAGPASGAWLISGVPCFHEADGRFFGYRGSARRPQANEGRLDQKIDLLGRHLPPDSVRQLVHELRTPLNAMRGFAEMISQQILGPASSSYRQKADDIINDCRRLLQLFDDLDLAAKLDRGLDIDATSSTDPNQILQALVSSFRGLTDAHHVHLRLTRLTDDHQVILESMLTQSMMSRLLSTLIGLCGQGEALGARLAKVGDHVSFSVDRPKSLAGLSEQALYDPSGEIAGEWPDGPPLGLGFALRLIENTAKVAGARLMITEDHFVLLLPVVVAHADSSKTV
ncbi:MAG: histidine kinase dimerization/phospho-acceptor domain-containing protein [Chakrabartia sp.]